MAYLKHKANYLGTRMRHELSVDLYNYLIITITSTLRISPDHAHVTSFGKGEVLGATHALFIYHVI